MKAKQIPITSGPAAGTMVTRVESNSGKLLGFIRVVECDWTPTLGGTTIFIAKQCYTSDTRNWKHNRFGIKACQCLMDAYNFLGVSINELDNSDLGEYPYDEKIPLNYWKKNEKDF